MYKYILATILSISAGLPLSAQQTKILTAEKHNEYGLVYSLPATAVRVRVTAVKESRFAGPYYQYAKKYIGTDKVIKEDAEIWEITDVDISTYGVTDDSEQYLMQLKPGSVTYIGVDNNGMLISINAEPTSGEKPLPVQTPEKSELKDINEYLQYVDEDFVSSKSIAKQAEMIANSLLEVREAYVSLTRGTAENMPTDGHQLELMLSSLNKQENALTRAFSGYMATETVTREYTFIPVEEGREILFRMSDFAGFVGKDDYAGEPVYINTKILKEGVLPTDANGVEKKLPKDAVIYGIPGEARITISHKGDILGSSDKPFAQFGTTFGLAPSLFTDKKEPSFARFSSATGALLEIGTIQ